MKLRRIVEHIIEPGDVISIDESVYEAFPLKHYVDPDYPVLYIGRKEIIMRYGQCVLRDAQPNVTYTVSYTTRPEGGV